MKTYYFTLIAFLFIAVTNFGQTDAFVKQPDPKLYFGTFEAGRQANFTATELTVKNFGDCTIESWTLTFRNYSFMGLGPELSEAMLLEIGSLDEDEPFEFVVQVTSTSGYSMPVSGRFFYTKKVRIPELRHHL